jgi:hypothetical protein
MLFGPFQNAFYFVYAGIFKIFQGPFPAFQRFSSSKLVLKIVESCFPALNYFGNASQKTHTYTIKYMGVCVYILYVGESMYMTSWQQCCALFSTVFQ